jgi:hypothetical protein
VASDTGGRGGRGGTGEEPAQRRLPVGTAASLNSSGGSRFSTRRGDAALEHSYEAGDGFRHSGARRSDRCCRFRTAEMAAGRRFMAREHARPCRSGAARGTPDGDRALMSGPGAEREKLTGGTPWQILF